MKLLKPKIIFEYGPGLSTSIMASYPETEVYTVEHQQNYFGRALLDNADKPNVCVYFRGDKDKYVNLPSTLNLKFDLIFIDGWCTKPNSTEKSVRVDCLLEASKCLSTNGVVILHDSCRPIYSEGRELYELIEEADGTVVMRLKSWSVCYIEIIKERAKRLPDLTDNKSDNV